MKKQTICNPVNVSYQFQAEMHARESADPAIALYKDEYYLFASHGSGYWVSGDLANWEFLEVDTQKHPQFNLYAPAPLVVDERMYLTHSQGGEILFSDTPRDPNSWRSLGRPYEWWDPALFLDDNGSVYLYEGASSDEPLHAVKLNPENLVEVLEGPADVFWSNRDARGFERAGDTNERSAGPTYMEGAWTTKINGKYYLTYAVPGTEFSSYCDGCAVSDSPMGAFTACENSPVVYKATGFMRGAGHGCLFYDKNGQLWKIDTVSIAINHNCERRLCLFPAKIGKDGRLYTNTYRGDYPMLCPHDTADPFTDSDAGWHLLSYAKAAKAFDENLRTWWSAATGCPGEWLQVDLGEDYEVCAVQVNFADQDVASVHGRGHGFAYRYTLEASADGEHWFMLVDKRDSLIDLSHDYTQLDEVTKIRHLKLVNCGEVPANGKFAVSGLRVFGVGNGSVPAQAPDFRAVREEDARDMTVSWDAVEGAQGYTIRRGIHPGELYTHWQVIGDTQATIHCLTKGVGYYVTVDAYNESGIAYGTALQAI